MINTAFIVYRQWGYDIFKEIYEYQKVRKDFTIPLLILNKDHQYRLDKRLKNISIHLVDENDTDKISKLLKKYQIKIAFFYSWSWIIPKKIIYYYTCLCLHPSLLPKYRGGTPIQHQIIAEEKDTGVTVFRMNNIIDGGPIYKQEPISFAGNVHDIFRRMVDVGSIITKQLISDAINNSLKFKPQKNLDKFPPLKRRTPEQSEIQFSNLKIMSFRELSNLVRGLLDPYPNAFIKLINANKLKLLEVEYFKKIPKGGILFDIGDSKTPEENFFIQVKNGFAKIIKYKLEK